MDINRVPILNYHKIDSRHDIGITTRHPSQFKSDMQQLRDNGYTPVTFKNLAHDEDIPPKPIVITFDDGYQSVYENALPILDAFGFKAVIFVPTFFIGRSNDWDVQFRNTKFEHLNAVQLRYMSHNGFEIGSHAHTHRSLTYLPYIELSIELTRSKQDIEDITGEKVTVICYPFGRFNRTVIQNAQEAGYQLGLGSMYLFKSIPSHEAYMALRRFNVYRFDESHTLMKKVNNPYGSIYSVRNWLIQKGGLATVFYQRYFKKDFIYDLKHGEYSRITKKESITS
ncbi:MAG: polysaccharide deacetylase family protein [Caldithrix sp.]|nr:polysaccharide deacetylase family protein [Caldithrix sp.]